MIYLIKLVCKSCKMKIELTEAHFGMEVQCPNCNGFISVPDINKLAEQKAMIAKELEELRRAQKVVSTNTAMIDRSSLTIKVPLNKPQPQQVPQSQPQPVESTTSDQKTIAKMLQEEESLRGRLKGLQAANLILNEELNSLKLQKEEFSKSLEMVKQLQKELALKDKEIASLKKGSNKTKVMLNKAKSSTISVPINELQETQEQIHTKSTHNVLEQTLNVPRDESSVNDCRCVSCYREFPATAKFCIFCGTENEEFVD